MPDDIPQDPETGLPIFYLHEDEGTEIVPSPDLAADWISGDLLIALAPRPLFGKWSWRPRGKAYMWFAVKRDDPDLEITLKNWREMGAQIVLPISDTGIWAKILTYYKGYARDRDEYEYVLEGLGTDLDVVRSVADMLALPAPKSPMPEEMAKWPET